jgi:hypothetical protein
MNAITDVNTASAVAVPGFDPFAAYGQEAASGGANYLKFSKGEWLLGQNGDEQTLGRKLVANMNELAIGWIRWADGKPQERRMGLLAQGFRPETRDALGYADQTEWSADADGKAVDPWTFTNELPLADPDTGEQMTFSASSKGGIGGIGNLCKAYSKEHRSRGTQVPVIELQRDSYMHPVYKKLYVPMLPIVGWRENMPDAAPEAAAEIEAAPPKGSKVRF